MRRFGTTGLALSLALVGAACNDSSGEDGSPNDDGINDGGDDDDDDDAGTGAATTTGTPPTGGGTTMGVADGGTTSSADDNGDEDPPPPIKLDLGTVPDAPSEDTACRKVDFLFVIDNSGSMFSYQQELVANFPVFIDGIQSSLDSVMSYQVGVVTTDTYNFNAPGCTGLSSLVVQTGGFDSSMMTCGPYAEGFNFMTQEDDLASEFSCAAQVGTQGDGFERTMAAVEAAVQREEGNPGQCNEGFIRDDALLVIVIITDEADGPGDPDGGPPVASSPGDPDSWYDTVVDQVRAARKRRGALADQLRWRALPARLEHCERPEHRRLHPAVRGQRLSRRDLRDRLRSDLRGSDRRDRRGVRQFHASGLTGPSLRTTFDVNLGPNYRTIQ